MIADILKSLEEKHARASELRHQLALSVMLEGLEPRAFLHGACKTQVVGNIRHAIARARFIVILGNGERLDYPLLDVPFALWGDQARQEYLTIPKHQRRLLNMKLGVH